mmetsp:Transcript_34498/g.106561  ORF Transcript_34498/g.106561 Transcript_34498/m.106561 type:complete len:248 (+) Transcript_34498:1755-2498(+)
MQSANMGQRRRQIAALLVPKDERRKARGALFGVAQLEHQTRIALCPFGHRGRDADGGGIGKHGHGHEHHPLAVWGEESGELMAAAHGGASALRRLDFQVLGNASALERSVRALAHGPPADPRHGAPHEELRDVGVLGDLDEQLRLNRGFTRWCSGGHRDGRLDGGTMLRCGPCIDADGGSFGGLLCRHLAHALVPGSAHLHALVVVIVVGRRGIDGPCTGVDHVWRRRRCGEWVASGGSRATDWDDA